jgi:hypothetical protein
MGSGIQPEGDKITIKADTFHLTTANLFIDSIMHRPDLDSLLLGTFFDDKFGITHADILARFEPPFSGTGFRFPENAKVDSAFLVLSYRTWFGSQNSVMSIQAFEMNRGRYIDFYEPYYTNTNPFDFVDINNQVLIGDTVLATSDPSQMIRIRLTDDFTNRLFENSKNFTSETDFFERLNGMYITSQLGDATMLHLRTISMTMFWHYDATVAGKDTTFVNTTDYVVNKVVINRFLHPEQDRIKSFLEANDSINYIASPAKIYTQVNVPLRRIVEQMKDSIGNDKRLVVNSAIVRVEAKDTRNRTSSNVFSVPVPGNMLLMPKKDMDNFFRQERLPTDSIVFSQFTAADSTYSFNIASYIDREIRRVRVGNDINTNELDEIMEMVLIPVRITAVQAQGGAQITSVKQQVLMSGVTIRSGKDPNRPMKINLLYSGF